MGASFNNTRGFTLVEISIVMIIIGLLIGGTFGGMKLVENMQVNRTVQDLKAIESAALTFRDTYGRLPGDLRNPSTRLPSCTAAPCATTGNGDRRVGGQFVPGAALAATDENFVFWHHLAAADLISSVTPTTSLDFGEGQPEAPVGGGYRLVGYVTGNFWSSISRNNHTLWISDKYSESYVGGTQNQDSIPCIIARSIDNKIDDGMPLNGRLMSGGGCFTPPNSMISNWSSNFAQSTGALTYFFRF